MKFLEKYSSENILKALEFATKKHAGQTRRDGTPYINHPIRVANNVSIFKNSKEIEMLIICALLHDTLEDTATTYYELVQTFGPQVASIVLEVTTDEDLKNEIGKERYLEIKMKNMSSWALVIKLCDRLDNVSDLISCSENFQVKYINETIGILEYLVSKRNLSMTHLNIIRFIIRCLEPVNKDENNILRLKQLISDVNNKKCECNTLIRKL